MQRSVFYIYNEHTELRPQLGCDARTEKRTAKFHSPHKLTIDHLARSKETR